MTKDHNFLRTLLHNCGLGFIGGISVLLVTNLLGMPVKVHSEPSISAARQGSRTNFGFYDAWVTKFADSPTAKKPTWTRQFGSSGFEYQRGLATDSAGNVVVTGFTDGSLVGTNKGRSDAFVAKYSAGGKQLWKRQWGTADSDYGFSVAIDGNSNVIAGGRFKKNSDCFAWLAKYSPTGTQLWRKSFQMSCPTLAFDPVVVAVDRNNNPLIASRGNLGGTVADCWLVKYNSSGTELWRRQYQSLGLDDLTGIATDLNDNVFLTGSTMDSPGGTNKGKEDAWVARFSAQGILRWVKQIGSTQNDFSLAVTTDSKGNVAIAGYTEGDLSGANQGFNDAWVAKYRVDGTLIWKRQLGTNLPDRATSISADATGSIFLGGTTDGNLGGTNLGLGFADAWTAKYSPTGKPIWKKQLGTNSIEYSDGVAVDNKGNVYLAGSTPLDIENP